MKKEHGSRRATLTGNAGEHYVMYRLTMEGFTPYLADRNNPSHDILVEKDGKYAALRVKTTRSHRVPFVAKKDGTIMREIRRHNDFVVMVLASNPTAPLVYIVPTRLVDRALRESHNDWLNEPRRDGQPHKDTSMRGIMFDNGTRKRNGFARKWSKYKEAWHLLCH